MEKKKAKVNLYNSKNVYDKYKEDESDSLNFLKVDLDDILLKLKKIDEKADKKELGKYATKDILKWKKIWEGWEERKLQEYCSIPSEFNEILLTYGYNNSGQKSFAFSLLITKEMWVQQNDSSVCNYDSAMFCVPFGVNIYINKTSRRVAIYDKFDHENLGAFGVYYR